MTELIFIEGVSGVGKSTMVQKLTEALTLRGYKVKAYTEGDTENPIDFYSTAYLPAGQFEKLCEKYPELQPHAIPAGDVRLVRYYSGSAPLFEEPLLTELAQNEFCYNAGGRVPLEEYTAVYEKIWRRFGEAVDGRYDFMLFDGSLLHHPINDMMRNYHVDGSRVAAHVQALLRALGGTRYRVFYLKAGAIADRYTKARATRGQSAPTQAQINFQMARYQNDLTVLQSIGTSCRVYDISGENWEEVKEEILQALISK